MTSIRKVLVINKYHFISGGAERYYLSIQDALRRAGVEPIPFAVNYKQTIPGPYQAHFLPPVSVDGEHKILKQSPGLSEKIRLAARAIYNFEAKKLVSAIIREKKPDVAYLLNINNHISPSVIDACHGAGVPVVMRMSDFNLVCASSMYFRDGHACTDCKRGCHHALMHKCVHGSLSKTAVAVLANQLHWSAGIYGRVSAFIAPSHFMKADLESLGIPTAKVHQINTFAKPEEGDGEPVSKSPYILYSGRFVDYKGADIAIEAYAKARNSKQAALWLMGDEGDAESERLKSIVSRLGVKNVNFVPFERDKGKLTAVIRGALFTLVPSRFYENLPNSVLESFSCGRPVIATRLGSLSEVVREGHTGMLFEPERADDFAGKMDYLLDNDSCREEMGREALATIRRDYSEKAHMENLLAVFEKATKPCLT